MRTSARNVTLVLFDEVEALDFAAVLQVLTQAGRHWNWRPFKIEAYFFIAAIYFIFCFSMSRYSLWIERRLSVSKNR